MVQNGTFLDYLTNVRAFFLPYHNHKETMAWLAVGASVAIPLSMLSVLKGEALTSFAQVLGTIAIAVIWRAVDRITSLQWELRSFAANVNAATFVLTARYAGKEVPIDVFDLGDVDFGGPDGNRYLPRILLREVEEFASSGRAVHRRALNYWLRVIVCSAFVSSLIIVWWPNINRVAQRIAELCFV